MWTKGIDQNLTFYLSATYSRERRRHRPRRTERRPQETQKKKGEKDAGPPRTFPHRWSNRGGWTKSQTPHTRLQCHRWGGWGRWWRRWGAPEQKQKEEAEEETPQGEAARAGPGASGIGSGVHLSERRKRGGGGGGGGGGKECRWGVKVPQEHNGDLPIRRWAVGCTAILTWNIPVKINQLYFIILKWQCLTLIH